MCHQIYLGGCKYTWAARPGKVYEWETLQYVIYVTTVLSSLKLKVFIFSEPKNNGFQLYCNVKWL